MTRILHIGDLHFWSFTRNPLRLLNKRVLGIGNLAVRRARNFRQELAPVLQKKIIELKPDYCLFSGDFTTTSLKSEFARARIFLEPLKQENIKLFMVPGNHDRYTNKDHRNLAFEAGLRGLSDQKSFPFFRKLDTRNFLVGIDGSTPNKMGSFGMIKEDDFSRIESEIQKNRDSLERIILLCHFPYEAPLNLMSKDRGIQLFGGDRLLEFLKKVDLPVVWLHGHHHYRWIWQSPLAPNVNYLNAGAPLMKRSGKQPDLGFHELAIKDGELTVTSHRCPDHQKNEWDTRTLSLPSDQNAISLD